MRALLAALALGLMPAPIDARGAAIQVAQMARDVTDAVRKQRAERRVRSRQNHQSTEGTRR